MPRSNHGRLRDMEELCKSMDRKKNGVEKRHQLLKDLQQNPTITTKHNGQRYILVVVPLPKDPKP
jgi:hypothetical protein